MNNNTKIVAGVLTAFLIICVASVFVGRKYPPAEKVPEPSTLVPTNRLQGQIKQIMPDGMLVMSHYGNEFRPLGFKPCPEGRPELKVLYGYFFLVGHPKQNSKVDDEWYDVDVVGAGVYEYTTVMGANKRIPKARVVKAYY